MPGSSASVLVHAVWTLAPNAPPLNDAVIERLAPYATRWAKTLGVTVWAVGGTSDELHLRFDAPVDRAVQSVTKELQAATVRFAKDTLGITDFAWESVLYEGVGLNEKETRIGYIRTIATNFATEAENVAVEAIDTETDAMPEWLREALTASKSRL